MNTAKSLSRINKAIVTNGNDPWAVLVKVDGKTVAFTVQRYWADINGFKGYKIRGADGYTVPGFYPSTLQECAARLIELAKVQQ
jgi:hypothetical protein